MEWIDSFDTRKKAICIDDDGYDSEHWRSAIGGRALSAGARVASCEAPAAWGCRRAAAHAVAPPVAPAAPVAPPAAPPAAPPPAALPVAAPAGVVVTVTPAQLFAFIVFVVLVYLVAAVGRLSASIRDLATALAADRRSPDA